MILFKFCSATAACAILRGNRIFVTSPLDFNDPFEMRPGWTNEHSQRHFHDQALRDRLTRGLPIMVATEDGLVPGGALPDFPPQQLPDVECQFGIADTHNQRVFSEIHQNFRILCLVSGVLDREGDRAEPSDILIWAHYADQFQGVCLALNSDKFFNGIQTGGFAVNYCSERPTLPPACYDVWHDLEKQPAPPGYVTEPDSGLVLTPAQAADRNRQRFVNLLTHKSPAWKYENEVRMIYDYPELISSADYERLVATCETCMGKAKSVDECEHPVYHDAIVLPSDAIAAVIFGADCPLTSVEAIFDMLSVPTFSNVDTYWSDLHSAKYTVRYVKGDRGCIELTHRMRTEHVAYAKSHLESVGGKLRILASRKGVNLLHRKGGNPPAHTAAIIEEMRDK